MGEIEIFSTRIKELRESLKMTQAQFSGYIGIKQQTLSGYERGIMKPPLDVAKTIAEKCNVSIDWLCGLSNSIELKPEPKSYKDIALKILELLELNMFPYTFKLNLFKVENFMDSEYIRALELPNEPEFLKFFETYEDLYNLFNNGKIKQHVIDTWLDGALEELAAIPIIQGLSGNLKKED